MRFFAAVAVLGGVAPLVAADGSLVELFDEYKAQFGKNYGTPAEELKRLKAFVANMESAKKRAAANKQAKGNQAKDLVYGHMSPLADRTPAEMKQRNGFRPDLAKTTDKKAKVYSADVIAKLPTSFDWREKGAVNDVKDQAQCGSCWAFGTVANIEGQNFVKNGKLLSLSEQELVDCSMSDYGCDGGLPSNAYEDMINRNMGLEYEKDYSYHAEDGSCMAKKSMEHVWINDWTPVATDEDQIAAALMEYGPLAIGINAGPMQMYVSGIDDPEDCDPYGLDHAVTLVGFGEEAGTKYWTIRNSWGPGWGESGNYRVVRGVGRCGLNRQVTSAIIN